VLQPALEDKALKSIAEKVVGGQRLTFEDGVALFRSNDLLSIGYLADTVRRRMHGDIVYFIQNKHINYTNVCKNRCRFCAFSRDRGDADAYTMTIPEVVTSAGETYTSRVSEFHVVGGLEPDLPFEYYLEMMRELKANYPDVLIQGFTAVEIDHLATISGLGVEETLRQLKAAGLDSLPGGGAEIFAETVRTKLCPEKLSGEGWLEVMRTAHRVGLKTNATMLYGHIEGPEDRVDHLLRLRALQDETGGFLAFIPLAFHPKNTQMAQGSSTTGFDDLKTLAISRLLFDNIPHVKSFWIMIGPKLAQVSLSFGVADLDGTVVEERITHAAGAETAQGLTLKELLTMIRSAGRVPRERDTLYNVVQEY
jgi:aminodeoxyfutalosine synthase